MKRFSRFFPIAVLLLLSACAANPPKEEIVDNREQVQQQKTAPQQSVTIIPDIYEQGQRGDFARAILARTSARFLQADENRDYRISIDEAQKHLPHVSREFLRYDGNGDGGISWQEYLGHDQWPEPVHGE